MANEVMKYFDHSFIIVLTLILMGIGILYQIAIGVIYQKMIQATDTLSGMENKLLVQCKERFVNSYKLNGGVPNIPVFVDKFINRIRVLGMSMSFMKHLSGQLMLAGVFVAGFGVCKGIVEGRGFINLLPFYIISLLGIYLYLSIASIVDMPNRRRMLKTNITDYLENTVAQRLEHGLMEKEKLLWELAQEKDANIIEKEIFLPKEEEAPKTEKTKEPVFSAEETRELEELLRGIIANKV
ncbi:MAG: hypothetical protein K2P35_10805 [Lachnospiraceae bacterium]|nr:hypothetical protein [Lachnospiraceae bacterium]MDE7206041.1 hypothetical protein [Lachnospiraceae bacterium]